MFFRDMFHGKVVMFSIRKLSTSAPSLLDPLLEGLTFRVQLRIVHALVEHRNESPSWSQPLDPENPMEKCKNFRPSIYVS